LKGGAAAEGSQESCKHCCENAIGQESTEQGQLSLYQSDRSFREPQLLRLIIRIRSRISCGILGRPGLPRRTRHVQNRRNPLRCQASTVSGWTIISTSSHRAQTRFIQTQKARSALVSRRRFGADRRRTASCCRKARFSRRSSAEVLNHATTPANSAATVRIMVRNNVRRREQVQLSQSVQIFL